MVRFGIFSKFLVFSLFLGAQAQAETWSARCGNLHVKFNRTTHKAEIFFQTTGGVFQVAAGKVTFDNGSAMRSPMEGIPEGVTGPISEIGLNKSRGIVYVLYRNPNTGQVKDGVLCETPITTEP